MANADAVTADRTPNTLTPDGVCWSESVSFRLVVSFVNLWVQLIEFSTSPWMVEADVMSQSAKVLCRGHPCGGTSNCGNCRALTMVTKEMLEELNEMFEF